MVSDEEAVIVSHDEAGPGYRYLVMRAPALAASLVPGQFVHVKVPGLEASALRRPFSVFDAGGAARRRWRARRRAASCA